MAKPKPQSKPNSKPSSEVAISFDTATFTDTDFDLTTELTTNPDFYKGDECVTLRPVPGYLTESLERYKYSFHTKRPGINSISSACIHGGMKSIRQHETVKCLCKLQERLRSIPKGSLEDSDRYDIIAQWFQKFPVDIMPGGGSGSRGLNVSLPEAIKGPLFGFAKDLSIPQGALGSVLIAEIIRDQDSTLKGHKRKLDDAVKIFLILCQTRLVALEKVMEMLRVE